MSQVVAVESALRRVVAQALPQPELAERLAPNDVLSDHGVDSLGLLKLISELELAFSIKVEEDDLDDANFVSMASIGRLVESKLQVAAQAG
jgi:acyl carrier protein